MAGMKSSSKGKTRKKVIDDMTDARLKRIDKIWKQHGAKTADDLPGEVRAKIAGDLLQSIRLKFKHIEKDESNTEVEPATAASAQGESKSIRAAMIVLLLNAIERKMSQGNES